MINKYDFSDADYGNCPRNLCPTLIVLVKAGNLTDSDCTSRAYPKYTRTLDIPTVSIVSRRYMLYIMDLGSRIVYLINV